jgi:hypothetical protein
MTTGSKTIDTRVSQAGVTGTLGTVIVKIWDGGNQAKVTTNRPPSLKLGPQYITYQAWKFGKLVTVRQKLRLRKYAPNSYPPKRAQRDEHPYTMTLTRKNEAFFLFQGNRKFTTQGASYDVSPLLGNADAALLSAIGRLRTAVAGSDFNLGVSLGESKEAFQMIGDSATKIFNAYRKVRRGDFWGAASTLTGFRGVRKSTAWSPGKDVASNWLQLQYGWLPLLKDVENGAQFLAHHYNVPLQKVVKVSARTKTNYGASSTSPANVGVLDIFHLQKVNIKAILREKDVVALAGLTDPLSIAWELTPYSFVVDWFIPIGNWLQARALSSALTGTFVISTLQKGVVNGMVSNNGNQGDIPQWYSERVSMSRTISSSLGVPLPRVKTLGEAASVRHCINAIALLVNKTVR